jgi:hypothetical protein
MLADVDILDILPKQWHMARNVDVAIVCDIRRGLA